MTDHDTAKLSPQQRGAQRRKEAKLGVVRRPEVHAAESTVTVQSEHVHMLFTAEADMLVISRALIEIDRAHSVHVEPGAGWVLTRQV
jgi:hypothetical protein